jgi:hypothetical protein
VHFLLLLDYQSIQIFRGCFAKKVVKMFGGLKENVYLCSRSRAETGKG